MDFQMLECSICSENFSEDRVPRNLKCGHSLCTACAGACLAEHYPCPECHDKQHVKKVTDFPVNYPLLSLIRFLANEEVDISDAKVPAFLTDIPSSDQQQEVWECGAHGNSKLFLCCSCSMWVCQDCLVADHAFIPRGSCRVLGLKDGVSKMKNDYQKLSNITLKAIRNMKISFSVETIISEYCRKNCTSKNRLSNLLIKSIEDQIEESKKNNDSAIEKAKRRLKKLSDTVNETTSPEELTRLCKELADYQDEVKKIDANQRKIKRLVINNVVDLLKRDLRTMVKGKEPVYAVLEENGVSKWAPIVIKESRLLLYSVNEGKPPKEGITIPYEYIRNLIPINKTTVFFEVETEGESLGYVYVEMEGNTPLTQQFILLCTAEKGATYRNTCFYKFTDVWGEPILEGGDYEYNDGTGGSPIVEETGYYETASVYRRAFGSLVANSENTRFKFYLSSRSGNIIGKITKGVEVLRAVCKHEPVTQSVIRDCGLLIPRG